MSSVVTATGPELWSELARALVTWVHLPRCPRCPVSSCQEWTVSSASRGIYYSQCFWVGSPQVQGPAGSHLATHLPKGDLDPLDQRVPAPSQNNRLRRPCPRVLCLLIKEAELIKEVSTVIPYSEASHALPVSPW